MLGGSLLVHEFGLGTFGITSDSCFKYKQNPKNRDYVKFVDLLTGWLIVMFSEWLKVNLEVVKRSS